ncbi:3-hydroxyacyl-CoA dehydrogenase family protein [Leucobacter chinensis]|uniref:3-hydroxyacyl-CoA dehydrogenase family protein n=1 Tax=Leucobacter chinensis TaxID=2851010 RepID=UPI001C250465|nr:3-hydroxyacyl-CoA dehydrogenase family protein [Leucobacter chinensis]
MTNKSHTVTVIGGGIMGSGIATATLVNTTAHVALVEATKDMHEPLAVLISEECEARGASAAGRFSIHSDVTESPEADLIIEAIPEIIELKHRVLRAAEQRLTPTGILTSNTSSLSITHLAEALEQPERFLGMHFFQPVPDTVLTELILHPGASGQTVEQASAWVERLGREAITASDTPGFATSRLGLAIGLEAIRMVEEGVASPEDIDRGMQLGYQHAVGPLRMTDMVGLDVRLAIAEYLTATLGPRFEPPALMRQMVAEGKLGRKSGQGFFEWPAPAGR